MTGKLNLIVACLSVIALQMAGFAGASNYMVGTNNLPENEDSFFVWLTSTSGDHYEYVLSEVSGANNAAVVILEEYGITGTCSKNTAIVSCSTNSVTVGAVNTLTWRNVSAARHPGNYSLVVRAQSVANSSNDRYVWGIHVTPTLGTAVALMLQNTQNNLTAGQQSLQNNLTAGQQSLQNNLTAGQQSLQNNLTASVNAAQNNITTFVSAKSCVVNHCTDYLASLVNTTTGGSANGTAVIASLWYALYGVGSQGAADPIQWEFSPADRDPGYRACATSQSPVKECIPISSYIGCGLAHSAMVRGPDVQNCQTQIEDSNVDQRPWPVVWSSTSANSTYANQTVLANSVAACPEQDNPGTTGLCVNYHVGNTVDVALWRILAVLAVLSACIFLAVRSRGVAGPLAGALVGLAMTGYLAMVSGTLLASVQPMFVLAFLLPTAFGFWNAFTRLPTVFDEKSDFSDSTLNRT